MMRPRLETDFSASYSRKISKKGRESTFSNSADVNLSFDGGSSGGGERLPPVKMLSTDAARLNEGATGGLVTTVVAAAVAAVMVAVAVMATAVVTAAVAAVVTVAAMVAAAVAAAVVAAVVLAAAVVALVAAAVAVVS
jgi:hypothetical protein